MKPTLTPLIGLLLAPLVALAADRPNVVLILADDLGARDLGCFGSTYYETPNIDRLASRGVRLTNAYAASPLCSPTRSSIMVGQNPARTGQRYLIGTITADTDGRRSPLTIAVSKPGESLFSRVFLIRTSVFDQTPGVSAPNADFSYPYAIEHDGKLYIGYTHKSHAANELAVIPIRSLEIKP